MTHTEKHAPDDRHDDVAEEQQIVDPPETPDADEVAAGTPED